MSYEEENHTKRNTTIIGGIIAVVILVFIIHASIKIVPEGYVGVKLTMGKADSQYMAAGINFLIPYIQDMVIMEVKTLKYETPASSASKDLQTVSTTVVVNYHVNPDSAVKIYSTIGLDYEARIIVPAVQESVKQATAKYQAVDLIQKRDIVKNDIFKSVSDRLIQSGLIVDALSITQFDFSSEFNTAIEAKVTAVEQAAKAKNDLIRIQIEAEQVEAKAIGEQNAAIAIANGSKIANILKSEGEAQAIELINEQLKHSPEYVEWLTTQKWDGQLPGTLVVGDDGTATLLIPATGKGNQTGNITIP